MATLWKLSTSEATAVDEPAAKAPTADAASMMDLQSMSTAQLKAYLRERGMPTADCFERTDLLARAQGLSS